MFSGLLCMTEAGKFLKSLREMGGDSRRFCCMDVSWGFFDFDVFGFSYTFVFLLFGFSVFAVYVFWGFYVFVWFPMFFWVYVRSRIYSDLLILIEIVCLD